MKITHTDHVNSIVQQIITLKRFTQHNVCAKCAKAFDLSLQLVPNGMAARTLLTQHKLSHDLTHR